MTIRAVVWGENVHEQTSEVARSIYPDGMHGTIASALRQDKAIEVSTATLQEPIVEGRGRIRLDDTWWPVNGEDLPAGTRVRIASARGRTLTIEPLDR